MPRKLSESVVVITGAGSGIGRATALKFAEQGATVVVAGRREKPLREIADECINAGARALVVPTDVTDQTAVERLARNAVENFGRIDVWVNNASVSLFSRFEEAPPEVYQRVLETNIFGYIYGARAVMPYFREQGSGVLINNSSMFGRMGAPYLSAYATSKFAIRGFSESLRQELIGTDIHVCTILPGSIDTPLFQHAANYTGRKVKPVNPVNDVSVVANEIVRLAKRPKRETIAGKGGAMLSIVHTIAPTLHERMMARQVDMDHFMDEPADPSPGNVLQPMEKFASASGGWEPIQQPRRGMFALAGLAAAVPAILAWRRFTNREQATVKGRAMARMKPMKSAKKTAAGGFLRRVAA